MAVSARLGPWGAGADNKAWAPGRGREGGKAFESQQLNHRAGLRCTAFWPPRTAAEQRTTISVSP